MRLPKVTPRQLGINSGDPVMVELDNRTRLKATALSSPWQLGHGQWVIKVSGISGGYDLSRVRPISEVKA
jgi:hypothetical protein